MYRPVHAVDVWLGLVYDQLAFQQATPVLQLQAPQPFLALALR